MTRAYHGPGTIRPRGFSPPRRFALPPALRTRWVRCRSWGSRSQRSFERKGRKRVAASLAPLRPRCSTVSNSEEYEVESSAASKALVPVRPGSTAVVPEPASPLRSASFPDRRRGFRPRWSPLVLPLSAPGRTMMRRAGTSGSSTDPETNGSTRDPQLPWGSCCIRKTFWRLPAFYSTRYRHTRRSWKFSGSPLQDARLGHPLRSSLPCHRTIKEPSTRAVFSSLCDSPAQPWLGQTSPSRPLQGFRCAPAVPRGCRHPRDDPLRVPLPLGALRPT
jgi:hypothetical protein